MLFGVTSTQFEGVPQLASDEAAASGRDLIVMKFGGTSVGSTEKIKDVARRLVAAREAGHRVVGVLSAMGDTTDELIRLAHEVSPQPHPREYDMLVSVGERISNALCAMAIRDLGHEAVSLTGSQAGIVTDTSHAKAKIVEVRARRLHEELDKDRIVLVAGFQGVSTDLEVTTLGRGGSDATAVALASALGGACEIYTDVEGVFTADPRIVEDALKLPTISYEEMLEMAATGARVMMARSIEIARSYGVPLHVRHSGGDKEGTWIREEENLVLEKAIISGVTHDTSEAKATVLAVPDRPGIAARVFRALADAGVNIDMIVQNVSAAGKTDISFTLPKTDLPAAEPILEVLAKEIDAGGVVYDADVAKVSLVGAGMKSHPGVAADMFEALADAGINIEIISTSSIRVSCVVRAEDVERAVQAIHDRFRMFAEERVGG
jgi:aspartate kinase